MSKRKTPPRRPNPEAEINVGTLSYKVLLTPAEEGGYVVTCPALPGLVTEGDTLEEARHMAAEAIAGYLETLRQAQRPLPRDLTRVEEVEVLV
jgi:predicted RNase H-like HicB family nuclease